MAKAIPTTRYQCSICRHIYATEAEAERCESRPISEDRGVKVGDVVTITGGDSTGRDARVESVYVIDKDWGHYAWERYWHTVALTAKVIDHWGHRTLTFDNYKTKDHP